MTSIPTYEGDLFDSDGILEPYGHYRAIRDLGPVVRLAGPDLLAVGRYDDVRTVLADHDTFVSGEGVLLNYIANELTRGTTLASDPPLHDHLRSVVAHRLTPRALRDQRSAIEAKADDLVARILREDVVDGVTDIAQAMPLSVVPDFLGFPEECRPHLLTWAKGAVEAGAPFSERTPAAVAAATELGGYATQLVETRGPLPGSLGDDVLAAADRGEVTREQCPALLLDYFGPSLETTISALGSALGLFARHPDQWDLLRADPARAGGAFNEVVRLESPLRGFTRVASRDAEVGGVPVPAGSRVLVLFASANRDERTWDRPGDFDITRDNAHHLGLGYGVHGCAGQGLARLEVGSVLTALARSVTRIEPAGEPVRWVAGLVRAWSSLPLRLRTA
jgi:cytochrome P450